jgi:hypothetical protein
MALPGDASGGGGEGEEHEWEVGGGERDGALARCSAAARGEGKVRSGRGGSFSK